MGLSQRRRFRLLGLGQRRRFLWEHPSQRYLERRRSYREHHLWTFWNLDVSKASHLCISTCIYLKFSEIWYFAFRKLSEILQLFVRQRILELQVGVGDRVQQNWSPPISFDHFAHRKNHWVATFANREGLQFKRLSPGLKTYAPNRAGMNHPVGQTWKAIAGDLGSQGEDWDLQGFDRSIWKVLARNHQIWFVVFWGHKHWLHLVTQ